MREAVIALLVSAAVAGALPASAAAEGPSGRATEEQTKPPVRQAHSVIPLENDARGPLAEGHICAAVEEMFERDAERVREAAEALETQDAVHYDIDVCIDPVGLLLSATCSICVRAPEGRGLRFSLDEALSVETVLDGSALDGSARAIGYERDGRALMIDPVVPGEAGTTEIMVKYSGALTPGVGVRSDAGFVLLEGRSCWYPVSHSYDRSTFGIIIRYPDGFASVCSGALAGMAAPLVAGGCEAGDVWEVPVAVPGASIVVGRLESSWLMWGDIFLRHCWLIPAAGDSARLDWVGGGPPVIEPKAMSMIRYLRSCFGEYPFEWLNIISLPCGPYELPKAAAGPGFVLVRECAGPGDARDTEHDGYVLGLAQSWWRSALDCGYLVSEGLAAYSQLAWLAISGDEETAMREREFRRGSYVRALADSSGLAPLSLCLGPDPSRDPRIARGKGSAMFEVLESTLGREVFCASLGEVRRRHEGGIAGLREVCGAFEEVSGRELDWFFYEWVHRGDAPSYLLEYETVALDGGGFMILGTIEQPGEIYRTPVPLAIDLGGWTYDEWIEIESPRQAFEIATGVEPLGVAVDGSRIFPRMEPEDRARLAHERGARAAEQDELKLAAEALGEAVALAPGRSSYRFEYGVVLARTGRLEEGLAQMEAAIEADPGRAAHRIRMARTYLDVEDPGSALDQLDVYVGFRPGDPSGWIQRALALIGLGRLEDARADLKTAGELVASREALKLAFGKELHLALGTLCEAAGEIELAAKEYRTVLGLDPGSAEARRRLDALAGEGKVR